MQASLVSLALSTFGRDALRFGTAIVAAGVLLVLVTTASLVALVQHAAAAIVGQVPGALRPLAGASATSAAGAGREAQAPADAGVAIASGRSHLGRPYVWGGASPAAGFDCSGLTQWAFGQAGGRLPRTAQQQFDATARLGRDELRPGDLLFFQICCQPPDVVTHVGIYVGTGQMLHAPAPGEYVRIESIDTPYWRSQWAGAGRVAVSTASSRPPRESTP
jgi:cell wall-associated NlpC family hydrolase